MEPREPWLVVGLGNPGDEYNATRHNVGFMVLDLLAERHRARWRKERYEALSALVRARGPLPEAYLVKPLSFMNLAGNPAGKALRYYKIEPQRVVVVHDELDHPFGTVRIKLGGGAAGHNGIKSCMEHLGPDFIRVRIGIDKPPGGGNSGADYVLSGFSGGERKLLPDVLGLALDAVETILSDGLAAAQTRIHRITL